MIPILMLAFGLAACHDEGPTRPTDGPLLAKVKDCDDPKWQDHPSCTGGGGDGGATAQVTLCAKQAVIEEINGNVWRDASMHWQFDYDDISDGEYVSSTEPPCGVTDAPLTPSGIFTYTPEGPTLEWEFEGEGFPKPDRGPAYGAHRYVLIIYDNPWPGGSGFKCLSSSVRDEAAIPNGRGRLSLQGSTELNQDLADAKIWIVRRAWLYCDPGFLINDAVDPGDPPWEYWPLGGPDATYSIWGPYWNDGYGMFAYDWLFEATDQDLVTYDDTEVP
jgi:hypothetical protein